MAQYEKRKKAVSTLKEIDTRPDNYIIVHYTCDNFKVSQIISSIAVRQLADGQTESFSLYKAAQEMNIENDAIPNNQEKIEKKMLSDYYKFVNKNLEKKWIHWGMNSDNYGFKAIEHRYRVLGGRPKYIADDKKIVKTFEDKEDCVLFNKIDTFIATDEIQEKLKALDIISSKIGNLLAYISSKIEDIEKAAAYKKFVQEHSQGQEDCKECSLHHLPRHTADLA